MITTRDRYRGCLMGLAAGDAVGTTVEFSPPGTFAPVTGDGWRGSFPAGTGPVDRRYLHGVVPRRQPGLLRRVQYTGPDGPLRTVGNRGLPQQQRAVFRHRRDGLRCPQTLPEYQ